MFILYIVIALIIFTAVYGSLSAAPWLPTKGRDVNRMIEIAGIKSGEIVYDLGCGDGRLVFAAAKRGAKATGFEVFIVPYLFAKVKSWFVRDSKILFRDFFRVNISNADVVFVFLTYRPYKRLLDKLNKELKSSTRVVVYCFEIKEWSDKLIKVDKMKKNLPIYIYKV